MAKAAAAASFSPFYGEVRNSPRSGRKANCLAFRVTNGGSQMGAALCEVAASQSSAGAMRGKIATPAPEEAISRLPYR